VPRVAGQEMHRQTAAKLWAPVQVVKWVPFIFFKKKNVTVELWTLV
jgi:hypothetical protein